MGRNLEVQQSISFHSKQHEYTILTRYSFVYTTGKKTRDIVYLTSYKTPRGNLVSLVKI